MTNEKIFEMKKQFENKYNEFVEKLDHMEKNKTFNINTAEKAIGESLKKIEEIFLETMEIKCEEVAENAEEPQCIHCGKKMKLVKKSKKTIITEYGSAKIHRDYFSCILCEYGIGLGDEDLLINDEHKITKSVIEKLTYTGQLVPSFERASECLEKLCEIKVSASQIQIISEKIGKIIFDNEIEAAKESYKQPEKYFENKLDINKKEGKLYIMADGSAVNTRVKTDGTTWKEMKLGLIFCDKDIIKRKNGDSIITKKEYVAFLGSVDEFKKLLLSSAIKNGYGTIKEVVVIGDGAKWIWNMCEELFPDAVQILDYFHMSENVHAYANYLYPSNEIKRNLWVDDIVLKIKEGKVDTVIETLSSEYNFENLPAGIPNLKTYLINNRLRMNYNILKKNGYFIGSGAIESGNKMVIHQRMKQSGMRWGQKGGQYIATLRTKHESNLWNEVASVIAA